VLSERFKRYKRGKGSLFSEKIKYRHKFHINNYGYIRFDYFVKKLKQNSSILVFRDVRVYPKRWKCVGSQSRLVSFWRLWKQFVDNAKTVNFECKLNCRTQSLSKCTGLFYVWGTGESLFTL
jgi:hypothetical protein